MRKLFIILLLILACKMVSSLSSQDCTNGEFLSSDGNSCVPTCRESNRETLVNSQCTRCTLYYNPIEHSCQKSCTGGQITDDILSQCYMSKQQCKTVISSDGLYCVEACSQEAKEYVVPMENGEYKQCATCQYYYIYPTEVDPSFCVLVCPSNYISDKTARICWKKITDCKKYVSLDQKKCLDSCDTATKQYFEELTENEITYKQCKTCNNYLLLSPGQDNRCQASCPEYVEDKELKICYFDKSQCPKYVSTNKLECNSSCNATEREISVDQEGYHQCTVCNNFFIPPSELLESTCTDTCSNEKIQDDSAQVCLSAPTECTGYISADGKKCNQTCDESKNEYPKQFDGFKKCVACTEYYTHNDDVSKRACTATCSSEQLKVIPTSRCVSKDDGCGEVYVKSSDEITCDEQCNFPDILKGLNCINESSCIGENFIIDETQSNIVCVTLSSEYSCSLKSSDSKRCVKSCMSIQEGDPAQGQDQCQACVSPKKFYISENDGVKTGGCKANVSADEQKTLLNQLISAPKSTKDVDQIKSSLGDFIQILVGTITSQSDNKTIVDSIENYALDLLKKIQNGSAFSGIKNTPQTVGSSTGVKTVFQAAKNGKKFKSSLNIKSMMSDSPADLTEDDSGNSNAFEGIVSSIIKKNPGCKSENCQDYPSIKVKGITSLSRLRRILVDQTFSADFPITKASQNYVCVTYDLQNNQVLSNDPATVSFDGTTATCALSSTGSTSLYLDTTCMYLNQSKCSSGGNSSSSEDDGLGAGGTVGIILGSIAFACIVGVGCFLLYKQQLKKKQSLAKYQSPKGTESA